MKIKSECGSKITKKHRLDESPGRTVGELRHNRWQLTSPTLMLSIGYQGKLAEKYRIRRGHIMCYRSHFHTAKFTALAALMGHHAAHAQGPYDLLLLGKLIFIFMDILFKLL